MSITSEINRIKGNIADAYTAADAKGATLPATQDSANLASCISSITGGGSTPVIQSLSITPTTSAQEHTAPTGVDGFSPVTVSAVTASIDNNITAGNIKDGVTILGVTGNYTGSTGPEIPSYTIGTISHTLSRRSGILTGNEFSTVTSIDTSGLESAFVHCGISGNLDFSNVTSVGGYALYRAFMETPGIGSVDFSSLQSAGNCAFRESFMQTISNNSGPTAIDFSSLQTIGNEGFALAFSSSHNGNLLTASFPELLGTSVYSAFYQAFYNQSSLTSASFPKFIGNTLNSGNYTNFYQAFYNCSALTSVDFTALQAAGREDFYQAFYGCSSLTSATFPSLYLLSFGSRAFRQAFANCTSLTSVSFPALTAAGLAGYTNYFLDMLIGCTGVTVHFPSNLQSTMSSWTDVQNGFGGTNTTVLFDLTATS